MSVGSLITASRFNLLQGKIATVMGVGSGDSGYGQTLQSSTVSVNEIITAQAFNNLLQDILRARVHQTGAIPPQFQSVNIGDEIADSLFVTAGNVISLAETDRFLLHPSQSTEALGINSVRNSPWNGILRHEVRINFGSANAARHFFNAGGEIRLSANIVGGTGAKTNTWRNKLSSMGTIKMNYNETTATGVGTQSNIGFYNLTSSYQQIFEVTGSEISSSVYSTNNYVVEARKTSSTVDIRAVFEDDHPNNPQLPDPNVTGTLTSTVRFLKASGIYVSVADPIFTNLRTL